MNEIRTTRKAKHPKLGIYCFFTAHASLSWKQLLTCDYTMDGSGRARIGWIYDDWLRNANTPDVTISDAGNRGYPQTDPAIFREMVHLFHQNSVPVGTHAVGDRAMDWIVDMYALFEQDRADGQRPSSNNFLTMPESSGRKYLKQDGRYATVHR